jgi:hypothetical protein
MTSAILIEQCAADGVILRTDGLNLRLLGTAAAVERWKPRIIASKQEIMAVLAARATWWRIHYPGRNPVEVWTGQPVTSAEILEWYPSAVSVEPIAAILEWYPSASCKTCAHSTFRGHCGEPIAAGLSTQDGVIVYHQKEGAGCAIWLAIIPPDIEALIQESASKWRWDEDDLRLMRDLARSDPAGLRKALT